jgi:hypothetical protein
MSSYEPSTQWCEYAEAESPAAPPPEPSAEPPPPSPSGGEQGQSGGAQAECAGGLLLPLSRDEAATLYDALERGAWISGVVRTRLGAIYDRLALLL